MQREKILEEIISGYRNTISERYQYQNIIAKYEVPETIDEETVNQLRVYFLNYMYPEYSKRMELNDAFKSLDDYIKHPQKLLRVLFDATKLIFTYGRHLPKILSAGLGAMKTFRAATAFENNLVDAAVKSNVLAPYDSEKIEELIKTLSHEEIEHFIEMSHSLFEILHDKLLIKKIKEVIQYLIQIMKEKQDIYSQDQIKGLEIGFEMINEGDKLFNQLSIGDQQNLVFLITKIEKDHLHII